MARGVALICGCVHLAAVSAGVNVKGVVDAQAEAAVAVIDVAVKVKERQLIIVHTSALPLFVSLAYLNSSLSGRISPLRSQT